MARLVGPPYQADDGDRNPNLGSAAAIDWEALSPSSVRLSASVAAQIEEMVTSGQLQNGRRLPSERRLAELLSVSRGSVREAITELEVKGLVTRRPGTGTHIRRPPHSLFTGPIVSGAGLSDRETTELLDLREAIEPGIAARAAERASTADIEEIRTLARAFENSGEDVERRMQLDAEFHQAIARAAHNALLGGLVERFMNALDATRRTTAQTESRFRMSKTAHRKIAAAIANGDPEAAEREMLEHVRAITAFLSGSQQRRGRRPRVPEAKGDSQ
jgi:GntR family transcriptional regulator, transcriptional repressor for pyruvate dehydrogenase complex